MDTMIVGTCELHLHLPEVASLKEKRSVIKSLLTRLHNKFNVSAAEVDQNDLWQSAVVGIVMVSNSTSHTNQVLTQVINWIESNYPQLMIVDQFIEII